jgi:hypothetical protein
VKSVSVSLGRREIEGKKTDCTSIPRARRSVVICEMGKGRRRKKGEEGEMASRANRAEKRVEEGKWRWKVSKSVQRKGMSDGFSRDSRKVENRERNVQGHGRIRNGIPS